MISGGNNEEDRRFEGGHGLAVSVGWWAGSGGIALVKVVIEWTKRGDENEGEEVKMRDFFFEGGMRGMVHFLQEVFKELGHQKPWPRPQLQALKTSSLSRPASAGLWLWAGLCASLEMPWNHQEDLKTSQLVLEGPVTQTEKRPKTGPDCDRNGPDFQSGLPRFENHQLQVYVYRKNTVTAKKLVLTGQ
ncbi:hypothetical protein BC826DRAFT_967927 [Russula brevipes]|nr:hypothetical protein BC826DRAFT_967927 [Russula brevipes]